MTTFGLQKQFHINLLFKRIVVIATIYRTARLCQKLYAYHVVYSSLQPTEVDIILISEGALLSWGTSEDRGEAATSRSSCRCSLCSSNLHPFPLSSAALSTRLMVMGLWLTWGYLAVLHDCLDPIPPGTSLS